MHRDRLGRPFLPPSVPVFAGHNFTDRAVTELYFKHLSRDHHRWMVGCTALRWSRHVVGPTRIESGHFTRRRCHD